VPEGVENASRRAGDGPRRSVTIWVAFGLLVLALAGVAWYGQAALSRQEATSAAMAASLRDLAARQTLIAEQIDATMSAAATATAGTTQAPVPQEAAAAGTRRVFARVVGSKPAANGWELTVRPATYYTGAAAFAFAASRGELPDGDVYISDDSTATTQLRLLTKTPVFVTGWDGGSPDDTSSPTATQLAAVLTGGSTPSAAWSDAWYWLTIRDAVVVKVEQQRLP